MKLCTLLAISLLTACSAIPPEGSVARMKYDTRAALADDCMRDPGHFGFPYTRAENTDLQSSAPQFALNVDRYCWQAAYQLVR